MLAAVRSSAVSGVHAFDVQVEVDVASGLPTFEIVGLAGAAVKEARNRVRSALKNSGFTFPLGRVTVNLAPAHAPKSGTLFDLPIALGILAASGQITLASEVQDWVVVGELSLDGTLRPVRGALCIARSLHRSGEVIVIPDSNREEVEAVPGLRCLALPSLLALVEAVRSGAAPQPTPGWEEIASRWKGSRPEAVWDGIRGQETVKRALEISVAGGHHLLMIGVPGAGKTMMAERAARLLPPLSPEEGVEVSGIYSAAGLLTEERPLVVERPFRNPHHSVTAVGLLGGGAVPRPGEVSLAHRGVLFLDELPEFGRAVLEGLRQPLQEGVVRIARAQGHVAFPAEFTLIAAANPCPCGYRGDAKRPCACGRAQLERYQRRLSGPLIDRIDLFVSVGRPDAASLFDASEAGGDGRVRERIALARERQERRFGDRRGRNGGMGPGELVRWAAPDAQGERLLSGAAKEWAMSPRAVHRVLKVARTIADLEGAEKIRTDHLAEALSYRKESLIE